jgi:hypothetical protein
MNADQSEMPNVRLRFMEVLLSASFVVRRVLVVNHGGHGDHGERRKRFKGC